MTDRTPEQQKVLDDFVGLDWGEIQRDLDKAEWFAGGNEFLERSTYLGRTWDLVPNEDEFLVEERVEIRKAADAPNDHPLNMLWWDLVEEQASERCISVACGDGDGCDIFASETGPPLNECIVMQHEDNTAYYGGKAIACVVHTEDPDLRTQVKEWM